MTKEKWEQIWLRKGKSESTDLRELNGYEKTSVDHAELGRIIAAALDMKANDKVLEVGCGAGALAKGLQDAAPGIRYVGTDRSATLVDKHIRLLGNSVLPFSADELVFADGFFDMCVCYGVFFYFDSLEYARKVVNVLLRQARTAVYIGDLPVRSHSEDHLLFDEAGRDFILADVDTGVWSREVTRGLYEPYCDERFNIILRRKA